MNRTEFIIQKEIVLNSNKCTCFRKIRLNNNYVGNNSAVGGLANELSISLILGEVFNDEELKL